MHTLYISWSRNAFLAGIVLALVLALPASFFPFPLVKLAAFALCLAAAALLFVVGGGVRDLLRTHGLRLALLVALLPLSYLLSYFFSTDKAVGFSGFGIETDTVLFTLMGAVAYLLSFNLFRTLRTARTLSSVVFWSLVAVAVFQCISVLFGSLILFDVFSDRSSNLVGKWNDLGVLCSLLLLLLVVKVEFSETTDAWRWGVWVGGAVLVLLLGLVNFPLAWGFVLVGSLALGLLGLLRRRGAGEGERVAVPYYSLAGVVVSILFLLYGSAINASLTKVVPVSSLEVRPSVASTLEIASASRGGSLARPLVGTGPNTFGESWLKYKPNEVNASPFWNLDFNVGFSTLATALASVGLLGALAWLVPTALLLLALARALRLGVLSREERFTTISLSLGSILLSAALVLYVPSQNVVLFGLVLSGAAFGFLWRQGRSTEEESPATMREGIAVLAFSAVLIVISLSSLVVVGKRFISHSLLGAGLTDISAGRTDDGITKIDRARSWDATADANRARVDAGMRRLAAIVSDQKLTETEARTRFSTELQIMMPAGQEAILSAPEDYRGYLSLARAYDYLASLKVQGAYENAKLAYVAASQRSPKSPAIPLALARLEAAAGKSAETEAALKQSLQLKPDYTDAILFVVQINVANNDLASAIQNTQAAVKSAPGVPSVWFELGLLYYAGGDTKSAIPPLEQSIALEPKYANAKYFLGLSYYAQGRKDDAQKLFQELSAQNPDNQELKTILSNIASGKAPLTGESSPTEREQAPINQ